MTPKEKAKELYNKMKFQTEFNSQPSTVNGMCKKLALICVDEMIKNIIWSSDFNGSKRKELEEVKQEINKI
tara:strand:- start:564 stop:776 length:213 start_codon:yes stop_codon:yes gene_type:complete